MKIHLANYPDAADWTAVQGLARMTVGLAPTTKEPTQEWKERILMARHSPIRELRFRFFLEDIPYWVSVHLCRHVHAQPYVLSQRNDRQGKYDRNAARQDAPITMMWSMNAEELMVIANKRLCKKASPETRAVVAEMCRQIIELCPEFNGVLVPMCKYHGGICYEMQPCGEESK